MATVYRNVVICQNYVSVFSNCNCNCYSEAQPYKLQRSPAQHR